MSKVPLYDWRTIEKEYIQGIKIRNVETNAIGISFPTHQDVCSKYGCSIHTVRIRSMNNRWEYQRKIYQRKLNLKNNEICPEDLLGESAKFDSKHLSIAEGITDIILARLEPHLKLLQDNKNEDGSTNYEGFADYDIEELPPLSIKELRDISAILKENHTTVRSILGETTTESLLEDVRSQLTQTRNNKTFSNSNRLRIKEELKRIENIQIGEAELEIRKKELQKILEESKKSANASKQEEQNK